MVYPCLSPVRYRRSPFFPFRPFWPMPNSVPRCAEQSPTRKARSFPRHCYPHEYSDNQKMTATSDANGIYQFNALGPAPYSLTVEHEGFKKKALDNVQIIPEQLNSLDLQLEIGEVQQTVTVSGTTQTLRHRNSDC